MEKIWLKSYPEEISYDINFKKLPVCSILKNALEKFPENDALVFLGNTISYKVLNSLIDSFACSLFGLGIKKGDKVGIYLPNCPQSVIAYYAILKIGAVVVQINPLYVERELIHQINDSKTRVLIYLDFFSKKVSNILTNVNIDILIKADLKEFSGFPYTILLELKKLLTAHRVLKIPGTYNFLDLTLKSGQLPEISIDPCNDPALIQYTGGTTGISKGVVLTHYNLLSNVSQARAWFSKVEEGKEVFISVLPFFHAFGMTVCMNLPILIGAKIIIFPKFDVSQILRGINKYKPTVFPGVPTIYFAINNYPGVTRYNLSSIKFCISGAAPLPIEVMTKFEELTGGKLAEGFGLTEASPITHCNPLTGKKKKGSIGLPLPGTNCKIVDLKNRKKELSPGEIGELAICGPQVMKGYWNAPDNDNILEDDWLFTGDIAKVDEDGYFYIVDRKKDMIISGGFNIYPREVEEVLFHHKKILEAAVIGEKDEYLGEVVKAYVVLKKGIMASETEIIEFCKANLAKYKIPKRIKFVHELPKNMLGKVLRRKIREEGKN